MRLEENEEQARYELVQWLIDFRNKDGITDLAAALLIARVKRISQLELRLLRLESVDEFWNGSTSTAGASLAKPTCSIQAATDWTPP
jgi:hypothetical protein